MSGNAFVINRSVLHHTEEDALLMSFFEFFGAKKVFVDVGGNLPSNAVSAPFLAQGWVGLLVEAIPQNAALFTDAGWPTVEAVALTSPEKATAGTAIFHLAGGEAGPHSSLDREEIDPNSVSGQSIEVTLATLDQLLDKYQIDAIDLLSIDTEGTELDILRGLDLARHPVTLILVEDWQRDSSIHRHLVANSYKIVLRTGFNSWYVPNSTPIKVPFWGQIKLLKKIYISSHLKRWRHQISVRVANSPRQ